MAKTTIEIKTPGLIKLFNGTKKSVKFIPYKENFATTIEAGNTLELSYETIGQYFYYMKQKALGLTVEAIEKNSAESDTVKVIKVPCSVTLTNLNPVGGEAVSFIPYRENFPVQIEGGVSYVFDAKTAGQCIYYLNQASDKLDVVDAKESIDA